MRTTRLASESSPNEPQDIIDIVKGDGFWQRCIFLLFSIYSFQSSWQNLSITFFAPNFNYSCARPDGANFSFDEWERVSLQPENEKCFRFENWETNSTEVEFRNYSADRKTIPCESWVFDKSIYKSTITEKWNLVCGREWYISLLKSVFTAGYLISVLVLGYLSDKYGRKPVALISNIVTIVTSILMAYSDSFLMFAISRFFVAVGTVASDSVCYILLMEIVGLEHRAFYNCLTAMTWNVGYMLLPLLAWWLRDWFWMQLAFTGPNIIFAIFWWVFPESPRWLMSVGKTTKAIKILKKAAQTNGVELSQKDVQWEKLSLSFKDEKQHEKRVSFLKLLKEPSLRNQTLIIYYIWFSVSFVYWGITYNTNELEGDPFVNFAVSGLIEMPANIATFFAIKYLGRKYPLVVCYLTCGMACLCLYAIPNGQWLLKSIVFLGGKSFATGAYVVIYVYTAELFPTVVRNFGIGTASTAARVGNMVAPFVKELGHATHPVVPQILYGVLSTLAGLLILLLPETNHRKMPDTLEEAVQLARSSRTKNKCDKY